MVKRKRRKKKTFDIGLEQDTLYWILSVVFFALAVVFILAAFGLAGVAGTKLYEFLKNLLGVGYFLLPALSLTLSVALVRIVDSGSFGGIKTFGAIVFFLSGLGFIQIVANGKAGLVGTWVASPFVAFFDVYVSGVSLAALFLISIFILFEPRLSLEKILNVWRREKEDDEDIVVVSPDVEEYEDTADDEIEEEDSKEEGVEEKTDEPEDSKGILSFSPMRALAIGEEYTPPPIKLLERDKGKPGAGDVKGNANIIKRTLANFGIIVEIEEVTVGPSVTRYALKPAEGVRLSRILTLQNNLELALAAHPIRIEAPIPGRSLVGVEVPNSAKTTVGLAALLSSDAFKKAVKPLMFSLGRDVSGNAHFANLAKLPHALIAGATGAGKSVTIHTLITSLLYRNGPDLMRFIMIDPKRVELTLYNGIPHLLTPVITEAKKAILALKWVTGEMERRYNVLEEKRVRDIGSYHENVLAPALKKAPKNADPEDLPETMPYIVVIIDELADIMSTYPRELEAAVVRLAQMSRAVGIHLILSTQRPSVNVITGLIKANVPGRVALQVASQVDSRTILDMSGAEKLLGAGDMLFISSEMSKPIRLQGAFISEQEVKKVVDYLKKNYDSDTEDLSLADAVEGGEKGTTSFDDEDDDDLYEDARETILEAGKASTSYLQRKLRVGYARAARLMDMLEDRGVIGPADGAKPREVLEPLDDDKDE